MSTISERWNDADREANVWAMERDYGSDFEREPPLVSETMPAARIFNWRLPAPQSSRVVSATLQCYFFVRIAISDFAWPIICKFLGHDPISNDHATSESGYMGVTCNRCGHSSGGYLY